MMPPCWTPNYVSKPLNATVDMKHILSRLKPVATGKRSGLKGLAVIVLFGLSSFVIGFTLFFPDAVLKRRLEYELNRNIPGRVMIGHAAIGFPYDLRADEVRIRLNDPAIPAWRFASVRLRPHLASLVGKPGVNFTAREEAGVIHGSVTHAGALAVNIDNFPVTAPVQGFAQISLSGTIRQARVDTHLQPDPDKPSTIQLAAENLRVTGLDTAGLAIDQLPLGSLDLALDGTGRNLSLRKAVLSGGAIQAEASGSVRLGRTARATRLNLNLQLRPAAELDASLRSLFELVGSAAPNGARRLNIRGTLARPNIR